MQRILRTALTAISLFILLFNTFIAYMPPSFHAKADDLPQRGDYACVLKSNVLFYAEATAERGLFYLPATYYVRLLDYTPTYCRVEYQTNDTHTQRLIGYVATDEITFVPYTPRRPYLSYVFTVEYRIENAQNGDGFLTHITKTCAYYGDYLVGVNAYCYVLIEGEFGYIPKPETIRYEPNEEYAEYQERLNGKTTDTDVEREKKNSPAQIAILVTLCLLVPLIAALILKPKRDHFLKDE